MALVQESPNVWQIWEALYPALSTLPLYLTELTEAVRSMSVTVDTPPVDLAPLYAVLSDLNVRLASLPSVAASGQADEATAALVGLQEAVEKLAERAGKTMSVIGGGGGATEATLEQVRDALTDGASVTGGLTDTELRASPVAVNIAEGADIVVSAGNSTTTPLSAAGPTSIFTGTGVSIAAYAQVNVSLLARPSTIRGDGTNAQGSLFLELSPDNTNWDVSIPFLVRDPGLFLPIPLINVDSFFRVRYLNDGGTAAIALLGSSIGTATAPVAQTSNRLTTFLLPNATKEITRTLDQVITGSDPVTVVAAVLEARPPGSDTAVDVLCDSRGQLKISALNDRFNTLLNQNIADGNEMRTDLGVTDQYFGTAADGASTTATLWDVLRIYLTAGSPVRWRTRTGVAWDSRTAGWT